jgi:monoamine oxidase
MLWKLDSQAAQLNLDAPWDHPNAPEWDSMTALTVINTLWTQTARDLLTAFVVSCFACEPNEISYLFVLFYIKSAGNLHMLIGTNFIPHKLTL